MNVKEWLSKFEFKDVWDCLQTHWPTADWLEEQYRDLFSILKSIHTSTKPGDKFLHLGYNSEGEIDNRLQPQDFYEPTKKTYTTDVWEVASLTVSRNMQDEAIGKLSDTEFAAAILRYAGNALLTSLPHQVPKLTNPFVTPSRILKTHRLYRTAKTISDNWDLWYSVCRGTTFSNKRCTMEFKEHFLHFQNPTKYEVSFKHNITKDVVTTIEMIEHWLKGKSIERLMMFVYIHPENVYQAKLWALWGEDRFPFFVSKIITDDTMQEDVTRLHIYADFSNVQDNDDIFTKAHFGAISFCPEGNFEFLDAEMAECEKKPTLEPGLKVWGQKSDAGVYMINGKMTDIMYFCKKATFDKNQVVGANHTTLNQY